MKTLLNSCDDLSRREFAQKIAKTCLGVSVMGALAPRGFAAPFEGASKAKQAATAKRVIYLYMSGGMTHLDTFGVVPGADTMGSTKAISTSADGVQVSEYLPETAKMMHRGVVINSLTSRRARMRRAITSSTRATRCAVPHGIRPWAHGCKNSKARATRTCQAP